MDTNDQNTQVASPSAAGSTVRRLQAGSQRGMLTIINTDFGADCDDQKAVSQHIAALGNHDQTFFIVTGPHPRRAAEAIAQAYHAKKGQYPIIGLGQQFEQHKVPEEKIFSLINDSPMSSQEVKGFQPVALNELHEKIDAAEKSRIYAAHKQHVLGPLHSKEEYYDPTPRLDSDPALKSAWEAVPKFAAVQFQRATDGAGGFTYGGSNFLKSGPGVAEAFTEMLAEQGYERTYFEGAVAKEAEFLLSARQDNLPGIEKGVGTYMENLQVPWANMPGETGTTPATQQMHVGMFTSKGEVPFGVHVLGGIPAGFGIERLAREVCGVSKGQDRFTALTSKIGSELENFDNQVLEQVRGRHPEKTDLDLRGMRAVMHEAMLDTLNEFSEARGVTNTSLGSFKQLADAAKKADVGINPFTYMDEFKKLLVARYPLIGDITAIAEGQSGSAATDGKSHLDRMTGILRSYDARAVAYDAVTLAAANVLERNAELSAHFKEVDGACNVTRSKVGDLRSNSPVLFQEFVAGIREELTLDGGAMAIEWGRDPIGVAKASQSSVLPAKAHRGDIVETQKAPEISSESSRKRGRNPDDESIADRVAQRRRRSPEEESIATRVKENRRGGRGDGIGL